MRPCHDYFIFVEKRIVLYFRGDALLCFRKRLAVLMDLWRYVTVKLYLCSFPFQQYVAKSVKAFPFSGEFTEMLRFTNISRGESDLIIF